MDRLTLREVLRGWDAKDLTNLWALLGEKKGTPTIEVIEEKIKWLYHSRTRAGIASIFKRKSSDEIRDIPSYDKLVVEATKQLKVFVNDASLEESELFISHAVIIRALQCMPPRDRVDFFAKTFSVDEMAKAARIKSTTLHGPVTAFAALGAAQASGFGIYLASTTALGFLTHAIGVTLPFAVYTGLTSTIAIAISPIGWLVAGFWTFWQLTQPKWKNLVAAIVYISSTNFRLKLEAEEAAASNANTALSSDENPPSKKSNIIRATLIVILILTILLVITSYLLK
jgi:hypothetical protein